MLIYLFSDKSIYDCKMTFIINILSSTNLKNHFLYWKKYNRNETILSVLLMKRFGSNNLWHLKDFFPERTGNWDNLTCSRLINSLSTGKFSHCVKMVPEYSARIQWFDSHERARRSRLGFQPAAAPRLAISQSIDQVAISNWSIRCSNDCQTLPMTLIYKTSTLIWTRCEL